MRPMRWVGIAAMAAAMLAAAGSAAPVLAQAEAPTTVTVTGGAQAGAAQVATGQATFGIRLPLRPNAENVLTLTATDTLGRSVTADQLRIAQISLNEIVQARVTATRLTTDEVRQLVAEGVINIADPANYNVSRFVVALVVGGKEVQVPVPVVRRVEEPMGIGEPVRVGCGSSASNNANDPDSLDNVIRVPCGGSGGEGKVADGPQIEIVPFEIQPAPGMPGIPGVIIIEGRIKTLKEFFKVNLLMMNVSSIFVLKELTARLELPEGALSGVAPAGGTIVLPDIQAESQASGEFIIRGDEKGIHKVIAHFGGVIEGPFLPEPVPFSGSASTDLEVKGPPNLDVKLTHPDYVTAGEPYELRIEVTNTDTELDALYTSMEIDVGGDADLIDEVTGEPKPGSSVRTLGDILRGEKIVQTYRVMPRVSGPITSCVGAAEANIHLTVAFTGPGRDPRCAIGTLPSARLSTDGRPTVTVVPAHNTTDVAVDPPIVALFSQRMIEATITAGYPSATLIVQNADGAIVQGNLSFTELFGATAAIFRPRVPLAFGHEYTIIVNPNAFNEDGLLLASGIVARFTTEVAAYVPDTTAPQVTMQLQAPFDTQPVARGQSPVVVINPTDDKGVVRVDLLLDGVLVDTRKPTETVRFVIETGGLEPGSSHVLSVLTHDAAGNVGTREMPFQVAGDVLPPTVAITADAQVARGRSLPVTVVATDDGRVATVALFLDDSPAPFDSRQVAPFVFAVPTPTLAPGTHRLRAHVVDGAGNEASAEHNFSVTTDTVPPVITILSPLTTRVRRGNPLAVLASAIDDNGLGSIAYLLDSNPVPVAVGGAGFNLDTSVLAAGAHVITVVATDTSGNAASALVPIELYLPDPGDQTPPSPIVTALVVVTQPAGGVITFTALDGAAEPASTAVIVNLATARSTQAAVRTTGGFSLPLEANGGDVLQIVLVDESGNQSAPVSFTVPSPTTLTAITVAPTTVALNRSHTSQPLVVTGTFSDGHTEVVTTGLTFSSSVPAVASVNGGVVVPGQNGSAVVTVTATQAGAPAVAAVPVPVTVDFASVTSLVVTPNPLPLNGPGQAQRLTIQARYSDNTLGSFNGTVRFATSNAQVAVVDGSGLVTSTGTGSASIDIASTGLPTAQVLVVVSPVEQTELVTEPASVNLTALGQQQPLTVRARFSNGALGTPSAPVTFIVANALVATVSATGVIQAAGEGVTSVIARSGALQASVPVSVVLPTSEPAPVITRLERPIAGETDTLVIAGKYFAGLPQGNAVTVNGVQAEVVGAMTDRLVAIVPRGATSGPVQVTVGGQPSNTVGLTVYGRRAAAVLESLPFDAPPAGTASADLGSATFYVQPGDRVVVSADPNTIGVQGWAGLFGPTFQGMLVLDIDGTEHEFVSSTPVVDITSLMPPSAGPQRVSIAARIEDRGAGLSSRGVAIVAGPPNTGAFIGQRFVTGDGLGHRVTMRFRVSAPDGTKFAATAREWYRASDGGYSNNSAGGAIDGGAVTPNDSDFRTFVSSGGEVAVPYISTGVLASFGQQPVVTVGLVPANAQGSRVGTRPVVDATILVGALDSASIIPDQVMTVADGVDRPMNVTVNSVRDLFGNSVREGTGLALTSREWYRRVDGGYSNNSWGGTISGGVPAPNDGDFRSVTLSNGAAQVSYSSFPLVMNTTQSGQAVINAMAADQLLRRLGTRPFAEAIVGLSPAGAQTGPITALPATLTASSADNRSVITITGITDRSGRVVPDGTKVAIAARPWYRASDGGYSNGSFGGTVLGGTVATNDDDFRIFAVTGGQVTFTYSNAGLVLSPFQTANTVLSIMPASGGGARQGTRPFAEVVIPQGGITSAVITPNPVSTLADGVRRPIDVRVTTIRDALGNTVPDGTPIALTARPWYRRSDGGYSNGSAGGILIDGVSATDADFRVFTIENGAVAATFSAETVALHGSTSVSTSVISAVSANSANVRLTDRPFAEGNVAVSSVATGTMTISPTSLLADRQARTSLVTVTGFTDAQGRPVPDGTLVALTAAVWYRQSDGGYSNNSAGGTMLGGIASPNDSRFRAYQVVNGAITATYSDEGLFTGVGGTSNAVISVLPATGAGNVIGTRPLLSGIVALAGMDSATVTAPGTAAPGSTVTVTLTNIRDAAGNLVPDGVRVAVTAAPWYTRSGHWNNGSAGGTIVGGVPTTNDSSQRTFTVSGGQVSFGVTLLGVADRTTVVSIIPADGTGARLAEVPFATVNVRTQ